MKNEEQGKPEGEETVEKTIFYEQDYAVDSDRTDESGSSLSKPGTEVYQDGTTNAGVEGDGGDGGGGGGGASEWADDAGVGEVFAGRFEVAKLLGEGGMGRVYLANDRQVNGRQVALKVLLPSLSENTRFRDLFFQEIDAATRFVSEHVIQVRDTGQLDDGKLFLTMDFVEGESLDVVLAREGTLGERHALEVTRQILLGLGGGHAKGYIHRDLKPSNVMLAGRTAKTKDNPHGVAVRLLDFGIAGLAAKLETKKIVGTPFYMSPEQLLGEEVDLRADLFAVGVVLYELLAGERPFQGKTLRELTTAVLEANVSERIREIDSIPKSVRGILQKALSKKRDERFQSSAEFVKAIERSKAFKAVGSAPALTSIVATVAVLAAAGEGAYIVSEKFGAVEAKVDVVADKATINQAVDAAEKTLRADLENKYQIDLAARDQENQGLLATLNEKTSEFEELRGDRDARVTEIQVLETENGRLEGELETSVTTVTDLDRQLRESRQKIATQNARLRGYTYESKQEVVDARAFDDIEGLLKSGSYFAASSKFANIQQKPDSFLLTSANSGGKLVEAFINGFSALGRLEQSSGEDAEQLIAARSYLDDANGLIGSFRILSADWIAYAIKEGDAAPDRQVMAEGLLELLSTKVQSAEGLVDSTHGAESREFLANPVQSDPAAVIYHGKLHECGDAQAVLELYVAELAKTTERADGTLDLAALAEFPNLPVWWERLEALEAWDNPKFEPALKSKLFEFAGARQWYVEKSFDNLDAYSPADLEPIGTEPRADWRRQLMLQEQVLSAATASGGGSNGTRNPLLSTSRAYYRVMEPGDDDILWYREDQAGKSSSSSNWSVERTLLAERPTPPSVVEISLDKDSVMRFGRRLFSLAAVEEVQVATWSAAQVDDVPSNLGFPPRAKLDRFIKSLQDRPLECLVIISGSKTYWISPEVGLVLEEEDGVPTQQLVYFDR